MNILYSKIFWWALLALFVIGSILMISYNKNYSMTEARSYSVNTPEMTNSLLILTQGSEYKDEVTKRVVDYFSSRDIFIQVRDISIIPSIYFDDWDVVVVMHTWEKWKAPKVVQEMVDSGMYDSKFIFLTTSGSGDSKIKGLDGLTGASTMVDARPMALKLIDKINHQLSEVAIMH